MRLNSLLLLCLGLLMPSLSSGAKSVMGAQGLLGSRKCTWGPTYWCKGIQQSKECAATSHCINKVWKHQVLPEDNDDVCTICKNMVQEARDTLRSNETISELKQVFEGSCDLIPVRLVADECKVLSDQFVAELVETLSSEMNPQIVCATAGLCNSARIDKLLKEYYKANPKTECSVCNAEADKLAKKVQKMSRDDILDKMFELCGQMSSYSDACMATVIDNFDLIYDMLSNLGEGQLCQLVGTCSETTKNLPAKYTSTSPKDVQCEFCEKVLQHWVDTWTANTTQAEFKQVLEAICKRMDKPERVSHCLHIVDDYYVPWFDFLLHKINPHQICTMVGLCGSGEFLKVDNRTSITLLLEPKGYSAEEVIRMRPVKPAIAMTGAEENSGAEALGALDPSQGLVGGYFAPQTSLELNKPGCVICEFALHELEQWLGDIRHIERVDEGVKKLCSRMPANVKDQCSSLVDIYGPALVQLFVEGLNASHICSRLQLCTANLLQQQASYPPSIQLIKRGEDSCALCEYGLQTVYSMLNDSTNQQEIVNVLDSVCYKLPVSVRNECEKLVAEYTGPIIQMILKKYTPDQICAKLKLCQAPHTQPTITVKDQGCVLCEYVITTLDKMIADKHNVEEVKAALDKLCGYLPKTVSGQCINFVDTYGDMIIDLIVHDLPPEQICAELGLCAGDASVFVNELNVAPRTPIAVDVSDDRPYCTLCEYAIGEVDKMIVDKQNEQEIKNVLDRVCYELSAPIMKECVSMVDQYTDKIIQMFVADYTPEQVCAELGLCKKARKSSSVLLAHLSSANDIPSTAVAVKPTTAMTLAVVEGPYCVICEFVMNIVEKQILNNRTFDMVERAVQMICSYMPKSVAEPCEQFVDKYGDEIIRVIVEEEMDPKNACALMALCVRTSQSFDASPVGGNRCAWGPSFWCQSRFHAEQCGTTQHCERTVWRN